jgi:hypothetical protein
MNYEQLKIIQWLLWNIYIKVFTNFADKRKFKQKAEIIHTHIHIQTHIYIYIYISLLSYMTVINRITYERQTASVV